MKKLGVLLMIMVVVISIPGAAKTKKVPDVILSGIDGAYTIGKIDWK